LEGLIRKAPIFACALSTIFGGFAGIVVGILLGVAWAIHAKKIA